ncbi:MAG TPA: DNA-directed RNA polymerase subunit delta [Mollicutes bacterium]|nr:DNA-directed RNA polymerase subunit delta [Mollicutes bacterium]
MDIYKMDKNELELLSYTDIAYHIIKQGKEPKTTVVLFKEICNLLEMSDSEYESLIADFFTSLTTDKRFILLNSTNWDLRENHVVNIVVDESEEEYDEIPEELEDAEEAKEIEEDFDLDEDDILDEDADDILNDDTDDMSDLRIISEEDELEE